MRYGGSVWRWKGFLRHGVGGARGGLSRHDSTRTFKENPPRRGKFSATRTGLRAVLPIHSPRECVRPFPGGRRLSRIGGANCERCGGPGERTRRCLAFGGGRFGGDLDAGTLPTIRRKRICTQQGEKAVRSAVVSRPADAMGLQACRGWVCVGFAAEPL